MFDHRDSWRSPQKAEAEEKAAEGPQEPSVWDDLSAAAKGGSQTLGPYLRRLVASRTLAYRDAMKNFLEGYREGLSAGPILGDWDVSQPQNPASTNHSPNSHAKGSPQPSGTNNQRPGSPSSSLSEHDEPSQFSRESHIRDANASGPEGPGPLGDQGSAEHIQQGQNVGKRPQ